MAEPTEIIESLLESPHSVSSPAGSVTNISISDAILADKYLAQKAAAKSGGLGIRMGRMNAPRQY